MKDRRLIRSLTSEDESEFSHICKGGVPVVEWTPCYANLEGKDQFTFLVDWTRLSDEQKDQCVAYIAERFSTDLLRIRKSVV